MKGKYEGKQQDSRETSKKTSEGPRKTSVNKVNNMDT